MSVSAAARAGLDLPTPLLFNEALPGEGGVLNRVRALASLACVLDPSLPTTLRAYRHVPEGTDARDVAFKLAFTADTRSHLPNGVIEDAKAEEFWSVMSRVLPANMVERERQDLAVRVITTGQRPLDAMVESGYKTGQFDLHTDERSREAGQHVFTTPIPVPDDAFTVFPDLATQAFMNGSTPRMETAAGRLIARFHTLRDLLSKPLDDASVVERQMVSDHIRALDASQESGTFEENQRHGWAAYAIGHGGTGWAKYLVRHVGTSPHVPYGQLSPLTLAVGLNDRAATLDLLDAGVSPNTVLRGWPRMFRGQVQARLNSSPSDFLPMLVFGAAVGSPAAVAGLLQYGAETNFSNEKGETALHLACAYGHESVVRVLGQHGADFTATNQDGHVPDELVPAAAQFNSLHQWVLQHHDQQVGAQATPPTLAAKMAPLAAESEPSAEDLWSRPAHGRRPSRAP